MSIDKKIKPEEELSLMAQGEHFKEVSHQEKESQAKRQGEFYEVLEPYTLSEWQLEYQNSYEE